MIQDACRNVDSDEWLSYVFGPELSRSPIFPIVIARSEATKQPRRIFLRNRHSPWNGKRHATVLNIHGVFIIEFSIH